MILVKNKLNISGTQHEGAYSRGGVRGGLTPPRHGCCVQAPDYIWDPARGGVLEGGGPGGCFPPPPRHGCCVQASHLYLGPSTRGRARGGGSGGGLPPPRHGCCVQTPDYILDPARGGVLEGGGPGWVSPPGTAAVSKHQTISGTQHEGACSRGGVRGGFLPPARLLCPSIRLYLGPSTRGRA